MIEGLDESALLRGEADIQSQDISDQVCSLTY